MDSQDAKDLDYGITMAVHTLVIALGMFSENMQRQQLGQSMAHDEEDFLNLIESCGVHHNAVMTRWQR